MPKKHKILHTGDGELPYVQQKRRGNRYLRISVGPDGGVLVSAPWHAPENLIERFVKSKIPFIREALAHFGVQAHANPAAQAKEKAAEYARSKEEARGIILARLAELNRVYGFSYGRVSIRNPKTIWGSCSREGNLSFHFRAAFLPERLRDYVIVHELCHLRELNHSPRFWALVAKACPDWKALRAELCHYR